MIGWWFLKKPFCLLLFFLFVKWWNPSKMNPFPLFWFKPSFRHPWGWLEQEQPIPCWWGICGCEEWHLRQQWWPWWGCRAPRLLWWQEASVLVWYVWPSSPCMRYRRAQAPRQWGTPWWRKCRPQQWHRHAGVSEFWPSEICGYGLQGTGDQLLMNVTVGHASRLQPFLLYLPSLLCRLYLLFLLKFKKDIYYYFTPSL